MTYQSYDDGWPIVPLQAAQIPKRSLKGSGSMGGWLTSDRHPWHHTYACADRASSPAMIAYRRFKGRITARVERAIKTPTYYWVGMEDETDGRHRQ